MDMLLQKDSDGCIESGNVKAQEQIVSFTIQYFEET
jgi:hypothetical protein